MKKTTALWILILLVSLSAGAAAAEVAGRAARSVELAPVRHMQAPPQAAQAKPQWSGRDEYDAYTALANEKTPAKLIPLADAFLQKYPNSIVKADVLLRQMGAYAQSNDVAKAVDVGQKVLQADPDNLPALRFLSFTFPFLYKADEPDATSKLSRADSDAHHGLEVLQKLQKPAGATDEQFQQGVKDVRSVFNNCVGFAALQHKDYANAVTAFKAAVDDNPSDVYTFYRLGLAYMYSTPPDYDHALWYIARAVALAKASTNPAGDEIDKFLKRAYVNYHGNDQGLADTVAQAAGAVNPPDGFKVAPMEVPKPTGDPNKDAFNTMTFPLKLGGEKAQKTWDALKGQAVELGGAVDSVEKGTDPNTYLVRIDILDQSKSVEGVYDIELKDSTQPNVKNLQKGDFLRFKGTADSFTATPSMILTLVGEVTTDLPDAPAAKPKPKPKTTPTTHRPAHKTTTN
jgi:tetratricopeptide (TPR) repeat protein